MIQRSTFEKAYFEPITKYNCDGMCNESGCSERYTWFARIQSPHKPHITYILSLCEEHKDEFYN